MSESEVRVQEALAAHLEFLEMGGPAPATEHLTPEERERLQDLIALLDQTEGVAFGRGLGDRTEQAAGETEAGARVLAAVGDALPQSARIAADAAASLFDVATEGWIVGTFGGRIRVWLVAEGATLDAPMPDLERIFRAFPDTAALALVDDQLSCLLVTPEDCAPNIQVPRGALVARRYRRPIQPVGEVLSVFVRDLIPSWEPMQGMDAEQAITVDVPPIVEERAREAIEEQVAAGRRARKTNPKRTALTELGETEASDLASLALEIHEGRLRSDDVEQALRRLATKR